ncbi:hypothetical protein F2Q69_00043192 [Brassica cretica]|uniref:Uncharacterized protein n=1 Tax=Brassica cretica TaxID=69181 RepID=A0A8S9NFC8_BRACR|nr:hypothetical protein F2Q69_00043192 [Brassica cretica]
MAPGPPWMHICVLVRMIRLIHGVQVDSFDFVIPRFPHDTDMITQTEYGDMISDGSNEKWWIEGRTTDAEGC